MDKSGVVGSASECGVLWFGMGLVLRLGVREGRREGRSSRNEPRRRRRKWAVRREEKLPRPKGFFERGKVRERENLYILCGK